MAESSSSKKRPPKKKGGRPKRQEKLKVIYLKESVRDLWGARKISKGFQRLTDNEFAKVLLHSCPLNPQHSFAEGIPADVWSINLLTFPPPSMDKKWLEVGMEYYVWFKHISYVENFNSMWLKYASKRNYFYFTGFCTRMQIAAIDHNMHIHPKQLTTAEGQPIYKKKYSKRSKQWNSLGVILELEKKHSYMPYLMAHIMKARIHDQGPADRVVPLPEYHPRHLTATIDIQVQISINNSVMLICYLSKHQFMQCSISTRRIRVLLFIIIVWIFKNVLSNAIL
ncbi:uncharacterized protein LOC116611070 [Nematostella vectensis]|uniref:uncharacterized protein LOC116611070 n=1 Tax=Nematostella vectensis TaxID=45351 RepID=UPI002077557B|nr:uncharacterized protein LOC116611070 [Nematostella vectensis]